MKQKVKPSNNPVTKDFLKSFLKSSLKRELSLFEKRLDKKFATKDDLLSLKSDMSSFKIDLLAEITRAELKAIDREQNYHSDMMTQFDKIVKKLETMSQENTLSNYHQDKKLEDHEDRIKVLESSQKS